MSASIAALGIHWGLALAPAAAAPAPGADAPPTASAEVAHLQRLVRAWQDARGRPFAVVDKAGATLHVYDADGQLRGTSPALLGLATGDQPDPSAGELARRGELPPARRSTPAGRFESEPGINLKGDQVVWLDYEASLAIHRLRPAPAQERRPQRLASASPSDNRITQGCVVVSSDFFDRIVMPVLGRGRGVVYVLPERAADTTDWLAWGSRATATR